MSQKLLLIQENENESSDIVYVLSSVGYSFVRIIGVDNDVVGISKEFEPDMVVIDVCRPRRPLIEMVSNILNVRPIPVVMFVEESSDSVVSDVIKSGVSAYVVDGYQRDRIRSVISVARARFEEKQKLLGELSDVRNALNDRKIIDRAKGVVMKQKFCDEESAYRLMRKMAMDKNKRVVDVAQQLLELTDLI